MTLRRSTVLTGGVGSALVVFLAVGLFGVRGYVGNFLAFRGYPPPREPSYVTQPGVTVCWSKLLLQLMTALSGMVMFMQPLLSVKKSTTS